MPPSVHNFSGAFVLGVSRMSEDETAPGMTSHMPLLLAILIGASIWIYTFTSWFPIFGSILGFGGVLMVVPALQGLMSKERRDAYSKYVDQLLFQEQSSARLYIVLLILGLIAGFVCVQPLRLTNHHQDRSLEIRVGFSELATDDPPTHRIRVSPGDTYSAPLLQPFLGGASYVWISSPGLPQIKKKVSGFSWPSMQLPQDLWLQPIILLRPSPSLLVRLSRTLPKFVISVERANESKTIECKIQEKYVGEPLWIGGGRNSFEIGSSRLNNWLREFRLANLRGEVEVELDTILTTTLRPHCPEAVAPIKTARQFEHLQVGDKLRWELSSRNTGKHISKGQIQIREDMSFPFEKIMNLLVEEDS
jgi:hypothetical protein